VRTYNFGGSGSSPTKLSHVMCCYVGIITWVQLLGGTALLKFGKPKNVQNLVRFRSTFTFDREYLWNA